MTIPALHYDNDEVVVVSAKQGPGGEKIRAVPYTRHARTVVQEWLDFRDVLRPDHGSPWVMMTMLGDSHRQLEPMSFEQLSALQGMGCAMAQGTLMGKPVPANGIDNVLGVKLPAMRPETPDAYRDTPDA